MVQKIPPTEQNIVIKFGGGLHTSADPDEIDPREAADGQNFVIDIDNKSYRSRPPFDLIGTVPNAGSINGGASLLKADGTVTTIFQAANNIYKWDGHTGFTLVGHCSAGCKLRGNWKSHVFNLTDEILITDLTLTDAVYSWNGTAFSTVVFTDQDGNPFGTLKAKYCAVMNERAMFANVVAGAATPHLVAGSEISNYKQITVLNKPSTALGTADPFFLLAPDLKPINGFIQTYRGTMISTQAGEIFALGGTDATNFQFVSFYANSAATGSEAVEEIGNDFIYGRAGRIESVRDTQNFGNSEMTDLTVIVNDKVAQYPSWNLVFNSRTRKCYCFPTGVSEVWVLDAAMRDLFEAGGQGVVSPWMRYRTLHPMGFEPTMAMSLLDPTDGLEYIFMGDGLGNIYRMEGTGLNGDAGSGLLTDTQHLCKLYSSTLDALVYDVEGWVQYKAGAVGTVNLTFQFQGYTIYNCSLSVPMQAAAGGWYWGGGPAGMYWNDGHVWNTFTGKMLRNKFSVPGHSTDFQVLTEVQSVDAFSINEIGIRLRAASQ